MKHKTKILIVLLSLLTVSLASYLVAQYYIVSSLQYQGPTRLTDDLNHFRQTGETRYNNMNDKYSSDIAYIFTKIGCLKTVDSVTDFNNRQILMREMNLPVYQRCNING